MKNSRTPSSTLIRSRTKPMTSLIPTKPKKKNRLWRALQRLLIRCRQLERQERSQPTQSKRPRIQQNSTKGPVKDRKSPTVRTAKLNQHLRSAHCLCSSAKTKRTSLRNESSRDKPCKLYTSSYTHLYFYFHFSLVAKIQFKYFLNVNGNKSNKRNIKVSEESC